MHSHQFYPPALTSSREESWSSPTSWSDPGSQHSQVTWVASSKSKLFQMPAVFGPGACDQQLIHQSDSPPKPKKYSLILMKYSARAALNTERAMCMENLAWAHWALADLTSSENQGRTCTCPLPRAVPGSRYSSDEAESFDSPLSFWIPATVNTLSNFTGASDQRFLTATISAKVLVNPWRVYQKVLYLYFPRYLPLCEISLLSDSFSSQSSLS